MAGFWFKLVIGIVMALLGSGGVVGFSVAYTANSGAYSSGMSEAAAIQFNFTQWFNIISAAISGIGGISGISMIVSTILKLVKKSGGGGFLPDNIESVIGEIAERVQTGDSKSALSFTGAVAAVAGLKLYFKGSPPEADANKHLEALLPLAAQVEWGKVK